MKRDVPELPAAPATPSMPSPRPAHPPVPPLAPRAMPTQDLGSPGRRRRDRRRSPGTALARLISCGGALALSAFGCHEMIHVVGYEGVSLLEGGFVALFTLTFAWISFSACSALAGLMHPDGPIGRFAARTRRRLREGGSEAVAPPLRARHALVMPVYNEDPSETTAALETMARGLIESGVARHFEIFILSDTTRADVWVAETACLDTLRTRLGDEMAVWYRRREDNAGRKAGNVRDFVERWGARYEGMLVLDADSLLRSGTILALARALEADPSLGILQSVPVLAGGTGLFARLQQFAASVYGPIIARGTAFWQGDDGNYWGHNAMIRVHAFAEASGLPSLPGRRPLGGDILSHDFVEAALVRKAGWSVRMLPDLEGSWENSPPSLLDAAARDRRWAQGNVQHLAVLPRRGLAWPSRLHFVIGVMSYLSSPLWLAMIVVGLGLSVQAAFVKHDYFPDSRALFPNWPTFDSERMMSLLLLTLVTLLLPKLVGVLRVLSSGTLAARHGGRRRFLLSALLELAVSALYAPVTMLMQSRQLLEIAFGRDSGWSLQSRTCGALPWRTVIARHWTHTLAGVLVSIALVWLAPHVLPWLAPVLTGLVLAAPLSRWSASERIGHALRRLGLLLTPDELVVPDEFRHRDRVRARYVGAVGTGDPRRVLVDAEARDRHYRGVTRAATGRNELDVHRLLAEHKLARAGSVDEILEQLSASELMRVLGDIELCRRLERKPRAKEGVSGRRSGSGKPLPDSPHMDNTVPA